MVQEPLRLGHPVECKISDISALLVELVVLERCDQVAVGIQIRILSVG